MKCKTEPEFKSGVKRAIKAAASQKTTSFVDDVGQLQDCLAEQVMGYMVEYELVFVTTEEFKAASTVPFQFPHHNLPHPNKNVRGQRRDGIGREQVAGTLS